MTSKKKRVRRALHKFGIDIGRWPDEQLGYRRTKLLLSHHVDFVVDVGANDGGYGQELRDFGYRRRIASFEPLAATYQRLAARADSAWATYRYALGSTDSTQTINVAGNYEASSSFLPMADLHAQAAPGSVYSGTESVKVRRLDSVWTEIGRGASRPYLKIDTQGFELEVLRGGSEAIDHMVGVGVEMSLVPLYAGAPIWEDVMDWLRSRGFELQRVDPGFTDMRTGRMLQFDAMFFRA